MVSKKYNLLIITWFLLLSGCVSLPVDTLNKRMLVFETTYIETLKVLNVWIDEGRLSDKSKTKIQGIIIDIRVTLNALETAKALGDLETSQGRLSAASILLTELRGFLVESEGSI